MFVKYGHWQWIHYFVKEYIFESFKEAFESSNHIWLLPYWCLCDGGGEHHRHGIIVVTSANPEHFSIPWRKVCGPRKKKYQNSKSHKRIESANHLCNTIAYLGGERSLCEWERRGKVSRNHHYYFSRPMSPHASLYLHMCYENGIRDYLWQFHGNRNLYRIPSLYKKIRRGETTDLTVRLGEFPKKRNMEGCVIPLAEDLDTCGREQWLSPYSVVRLERFFPTFEGCAVKVEKYHTDKRDYFAAKISSNQSYLERLDDVQYELSRSQRRFARHLVEFSKWLDQAEDVIVMPVVERRLEKKEEDQESEIMLATARENYKMDIRQLQAEVAQLKSENESLRRDAVREGEFQKELRKVKDEKEWQVGQLQEQLRKERERFEAQRERFEEKFKDYQEKCEKEIRELRESLDRELRERLQEKNAEIRELRERLEARDLEIKNCLFARYEDAVRERVETKLYHKQAMESLKEHRVETMRLMDEKMALKDQIQIFMQRIVDHLCNFNPLKRRRLSEPSSDVSPPV